MARRPAASQAANPAPTTALLKAPGSTGCQARVSPHPRLAAGRLASRARMARSLTRRPHRQALLARLRPAGAGDLASTAGGSCPYWLPMRDTPAGQELHRRAPAPSTTTPRLLLMLLTALSTGMC